VSDDDGLHADMHRLLGFLKAASPVTDQDALERLLAGRLDPAGAPAGHAGLARLLAAATAPAAPEELAGEHAALAEFAAVVRSQPTTPVPRRAAMPSKLLSVKAAAAVLAAVLSVGGVAAATGLLPSQAQPAADQAPSTTAARAAGHGLGDAAVVDLGAAAKAGLCRAWQAGQGADSGRRADSPAFRALAVAAGGAGNVAAYCAGVTAGQPAGSGQGRAGATGPDAMAAAREGLCQAWQADQGADSGRRADSVAFRALAAAAGGADEVAAFCQASTPGGAGTHGQGQGSSPASVAPPSTAVVPPSSGPPPNTGPGGHGQGGPPTTTG
jgi:hypothetical protein